MTKRDDFKQKTKLRLARRTGYRCSNPACYAWTSAPDLNTADEILFYGRAAHITAASPEGPRYDPHLTPDERCSIENGIYLCDICATTIDEEEAKYPVKLLRDWKRSAEKRAYELVSQRRTPGSLNPILSSPPTKLGKRFGFKLAESPVLCSRVLDDITDPWFFDDVALVYRFLICRNIEWTNTVLLNNIFVRVHSFERIEDVPTPMFPMGARCVPFLFHSIIGDPTIENSSQFIAREIGPINSFPTPILMDEDPIVVDLRIDTNTCGLYSFSVHLIATTGNSNTELELAEKSLVYFYD